VIAVAAVVGYLFGALPTAQAIARTRGIDLRSGGSGNPGANNALRLSGPSLAASVLFVEMTKGAVATLFAAGLAGDPGVVAAGIAAAAGNVYNVFYKFRSGKGLGITAGVMLVAWPLGIPPVLGVLVAAVLITRSSGAASIIAIVGLNVFSLLWVWQSWPVAWGIAATAQLVGLTFGIGLILWRKHWREARFRRPAPG
jgi:glycerol-3-phosphate acyltransferase PlsY